eukprot:scaffold268066_cov37-Tisochrysis_lutea.AAC.1
MVDCHTEVHFQQGAQALGSPDEAQEHDFAREAANGAIDKGQGCTQEHARSEALLLAELPRRGRSTLRAHRLACDPRDACTHPSSAG